MKRNKFLNRLIIFISCFSLLFSLFSFNVFADDSDYGVTSEDVWAPWNDSQNNNVMSLPSAQFNQATAELIFQYWDYAYAHNMTNGSRLLACAINRASNTLRLYFLDPLITYDYYTFNDFGSSNALLLYNSNGGIMKNVPVIVETQLLLGNTRFFNSTATSSTNGYLILEDLCAYRDRDGSIVVYDEYGFVDSSVTTAYAPMVAAYDRLINYVNSSSGGGVVVNAYSLDIGSIFTSMMTASMSIFNGFFGFTLFGINIAGTLVAVLVVAIVVFVVKWLLGGK